MIAWAPPNAMEINDLLVFRGVKNLCIHNGDEDVIGAYPERSKLDVNAFTTV